jgi:hypothetical protein
VGIMNLGRKLETRDSLLQVCLKGRHHDEHKSLRVPTERILEEVGQLRSVSTRKSIGKSG